MELQDALCLSHHEENDCIIEVESSIDANTAFHRFVKKNYSNFFRLLDFSPFIGKIKHLSGL